MTNENEFYDSEPNLEWANASISDVPRDQGFGTNSGCSWNSTRRA